VGGIEDYICQISSDNRIEILTDYTILEFGPDLSDIIHVERGENISLIDGDSIHYSSAINYDPYSFSKGMIVSADGLDSSNNKVTLNWTIEWTNQCSVEPNLENVSLGWFVFDSLESAVEEYCYPCSSKKKSKKCKSKKGKGKGGYGKGKKKTKSGKKKKKSSKPPKKSKGGKRSKGGKKSKKVKSGNGKMH